MKDKNKIIVLISGVLVILLMVVGISFAIFRFGEESTNQELVLGDIWMKYTESNGISLENALPGDEYTNYFEFTITGTNTYAKKDIYYDISLVHGDVPAGKVEDNRVEDKYLKFRLTEVNEDIETEIFTDKIFSSLENERIHVDTIEKSTNTYSKTYRLYMVISEELTYGNSEGAILTTEEFGKIFGSIKVNVSGDFNEKDMGVYLKDIFKEELLARENSYVLEDGIYYVSGKDDDNDSSTTDDIDFNYVWYSGKLWRITSINSDGTMKMITDNGLTSMYFNSYSGDTGFYNDEDVNSYVYQWLNEDFLDTLYNYEEIIKTNSNWDLTPTDDININLNEEKTMSAKVGLLNSYEYYKSFEKSTITNNYLVKEYHWWLLNESSSNSANIWYVHSNGTSLGSARGGTNTIRPVINLKSTTIITSGNGSKSNPYRILGDKEEVIYNTTLLNSRNSGEYILFDNNLYRIIETYNGTTKLIKTSLLKDTSNNLISKPFGSSSTDLASITYGSSSTTSISYIAGYLNKTWYNSITSSYKNMMTEGIYYLGKVSGNYKTAICKSADGLSTKDCEKTTSTWTGLVGLPRFGEMFSFVHDNSVGNSTGDNYFLITPTTSSYTDGTTKYYIWSVNPKLASLDTTYSLATYSKYICPTINLKSTLVIKSGSGTENDPFVVGLPS